MNSLLIFSHWMDKLSEQVGTAVKWLVLVAVLISTGNAIMRKAFSISSNGLLEIQWYLFSGIFLLGAGYAFLRNAHVRIDFVSGRLSPRTRSAIDIVGILAVIVPLCCILIGLSWPLLVNAWVSGEMSPDAGGLIRWPVYSLVPIGMVLLLLQSASELIKRAAFIMGLIPDPIAEPELEDIPEVQTPGHSKASESANETREQR
ncbi:C4-dicarboxylate ABC transporter substrate-binding protein [Pollutimonas subterranea]|uniref:TRAP transporter small permease protein n=1 Tax=Pollutimonas subterranea TaxID=2045210 RepID=A0A2N4U6T5_9BURK|nr:TRAP transporter small permease subunit [Pollutimonas subterranea]PLC50730.1 C4-dicarboxylate ABC transporter substrate-binding protein [Pollutimonas subterranea]